MKIASPLVSAILLATLAGPASADKRPVDWVKPQIDTVKPRWFYFNSACRPFGMVNLSPDTQTKGDWDAGYRYKDDTIECFSHIHGWQLAGMAVMPVTGKNDLKSYASKFSHEGEIVRPGYHKVFLQTHGITAELTSTTRVGFHRYTYPPGETARVVLDLAKPLMECKMLDIEAKPSADRTAVEGTFTMSPTTRRPKPFKVYFTAKFPIPFETIGDWKSGKAVVDFGKAKDPVLMKVAISYTGIEGARANLTTELPHWDFDRVCTESGDDWNAWLGRIQVEGGSDAQKTKFYTDIWHSLLGRRIVSDVDGRYVDNTGTSSVVRQGKLPHHNFDALWGAQWSLNVLWPLAWPEVMDSFAETMINMYHNGGLIPRGPAGGNYTYVMIGDPAASFFAAAWHKGIRNWDAEAAYAGLRKNAFPGGIRDHAGYEHRKQANGGGMTYYVDRGYVPEDIPKSQGGHRQGAAMTLEYAYQDWCLAQFAKSLGKTEDAAMFEKRALNYQNIWDKQVGWMRPRRLDGSWYEPFEPVAVGFAAKGFVESTSAIYSFYVPHDLPQLATLFGGAEAMAERLEGNFNKAEPLRFIADHGKHAIAWVDYENQPSTGMAHVFSHIGKPWRSQYWVRKVHSTTFSDITPFGGYNGDEDQGQMGALSALMAIGLFDMDGGASIHPKFDLTAPVFDRITIQLNPAYHPGRTFVITTKNNRPENCYIQAARLNGEPWISYQLPHGIFSNGGILELDLGPKPNEAWGLKGLPR
jgi:predicted alpha-1,2-mannosidase